jgi:hypothetical protein
MSMKNGHLEMSIPKGNYEGAVMKLRKKVDVKEALCC